MFYKALWIPAGIQRLAQLYNNQVQAMKHLCLSDVTKN